MLQESFYRLLPDGTTHCVVEERLHRGSTTWALVAVVPNGASIPINGYSSRELADSTMREVNERLAA